MPIRWLGSATARLVALIFVLQIIVTGAALFYARTAIGQQFERDQQELVGEVQADLAGWHRKGGDAALAAEIRTRLATLRGENLLLLMTAADGHVVAGNLRGWPAGVPRVTRWRTSALYRTGSDRIERIGVSAMALPGSGHLLTGRVIENGIRLTRISERVLIIAFVLALPLALLVAAAATRWIDRRIADIAATASAVGDGDLARRVAMNGSGDGFDRLARGVNTMLARIETLVSELRIVTGGLAHDLRAPIFRLTATLERAIADTSDPAALVAMERVSVEAGRLQAMLATAMQISQAEAGIGRDRIADSDIAVLLGDIAELYEPVTEAAGIALRVVPVAGHFRLNRELVAQALGNLVDNALKYADGATAITLAAVRDDELLTLTVADDGVGIAAVDREAALRRFGRLDPSRHGHGAGLGLSLVEAVARLHDGTAALADNGPGLRVIMTLRQG